MNQHDRQTVDVWARRIGYADFDTYMRTGGSYADAMVSVNEEMARLRHLQQVLASWRAPPAAREHQPSADCWCGPVPDVEEPTVLVHREVAAIEGVE